VHLDGIAVGTPGTTIFTLPKAYWPRYPDLQSTRIYAQYSNRILGQISIHINGNVYFDFGDLGNVSLDGITFNTR